MQVFNYRDIANIKIGRIFPIKYLAEDPSKIAIADDIPHDEYQNLYNKIMVKKGIMEEECLEVYKNGVIGNAIINSLIRTRKMKNGNPELEIKMTVISLEEEKIDVSIIKFIERNSVSYIQPGHVIEVRYMPYNPEKIILKLPLS